MSTSEGEYDPLEDPRWVHGPIWLAISAVLLDRLVTVLFWSLESNPVVQALGIGRWLVLTVILTVGMSFVWYECMGVKSRIVRALVWGVVIGHILTAVTNVYYALAV